jgi:hydrogenase expression/formation protein HypC
MCLAVPMRLVEVKEDATGTVELEGARYPVSLMLLTDPKPGAYVIVHAGFAIAVLNETEAQERIALFDDLARAGALPTPTGS